MRYVQYLVWSSHFILNPKWVASSVSLRLNDIGQQNWCAEVNRNRLCTNYRIFKEINIFEEYLIKLDYLERLALCRFRCGNHRLPVSEGRYLPNQEDKFCTLCKMNDPGDEFHFLFKCPFFETDRKVLIKTYYTRRPNVLKMKQLFNSKNIRVLKKLSRFCQIIMARFWCLVITVLLHCMYCKILLPLFAIKGEVQLWEGGRSNIKINL